MCRLQLHRACPLCLRGPITPPVHDFRHADDQLFEFDNCKLVKLKLVPYVGGLTELRCTLQSLIEDRHGIYKWMGKDIRVALEFGDLKEREKEKAKAAQPDLPMDHPKDHPKDAAASDAAGAAAVGSPEQEREAAHARERNIAQQIESDRNADPPRSRRKSNGGSAAAAA